MRDDERHGRVAKNIADALGRVVGVEGNVSRARLHQREERGIGLWAPVEQHGDPVARLHAVRKKDARHLVGARVELAKGDARAIDVDSEAVGEAAARILDYVVEALAVAPPQRRCIADDGELGASSRSGGADAPLAAAREWQEASLALRPPSPQAGSPKEFGMASDLSSARSP